MQIRKFCVGGGSQKDHAVGWKWLNCAPFLLDYHQQQQKRTSVHLLRIKYIKMIVKFSDSNIQKVLLVVYILYRAKMKNNMFWINHLQYEISKFWKKSYRIVLKSGFALKYKDVWTSGRNLIIFCFWL